MVVIDSTIINWPAVIKYHGENELTYVSSELEWNSDADLSEFNYGESDRLIDSGGHVYHLEDKDSGYIYPILTESTIPLYEFLSLVKLHASAQGECCIEKMMFKSIAEGMKIVESLSQH